ncbi:MAG: LysR family transcriptional regulator [Proteobacteria bacterium]|nr:LysR family transcriptional regulator [Pseudomonadota bacterium]MCP4916943.1 LysR family transcriptional regulator [Pseudomonadota bacterium]
MDTLNGMRAFTRVVDEGSFTAAARSLGLPKSTVSRHVAALEDRLGVRLLHRTTRSLRPTDVGQAYYARAAAILADVEEAEQAVTHMQSTPRGRLRVTAGVSFGTGYLGTIIAGFLERYPDVEAEAVLTDRYVDLIGEGFDVALRAGSLDDSSLIARRLGSARVCLVGSPDYLARRGTPKVPSDLRGHECIRYSLSRTGGSWTLRDEAVPVKGRLTLDNGELILDAAIRGIGLARLPTFICGAAIQKGDLVTVLDEHLPQAGGVYAVYPHNRHLSAKVRAFVDHAVESCKPVAPWDALS